MYGQDEVQVFTKGLLVQKQGATWICSAQNCILGRIRPVYHTSYPGSLKSFKKLVEKAKCWSGPFFFTLSSLQGVVFRNEILF